VTGPTGSGESTTLAAVIDAVNRTCSVQLRTLEDPIEFIHPRKAAHKTSTNSGATCSPVPRAIRMARNLGMQSLNEELANLIVARNVEP
jgi:twitching motility protein PilT